MSTPEDISRRAFKMLRPLAFGTAVPPIVYHYTTLSALVGILRTRSFWCSNVAYANDPDEAVYAHDLIVRRVKANCSEVTVQIVQDAMQMSVYYAGSFSARSDMLPQWRAYCHGGRGVALGVYSGVLRDHPEMMFGRVIYDSRMQAHYIDKIIALLAPEVDAARDATQRYQMESLLATFLAIIAGMCKSQAYRSEEEYRFFRGFTGVAASKREDIEFRVTPTSLIPYIDADLTTSRNKRASQPFAELVIGPCLDVELIQPVLEMMLERHAASPVNVRPSKVRMRPE